MFIIILYVKCLFFYKQLRSEETVELQHIMEEISKMFSGRRRGTEWSVPWPYKGSCYCFLQFFYFALLSDFVHFFSSCIC